MMRYVWIIGIILLVASPLSDVSAFSFFGPKDYEECEAAAAKEAKTETALTILRQKCASDFPARRWREGGYYFYDAQTNMSFFVSGPRMSKSDWDRINAERQKKHTKKIA